MSNRPIPDQRKQRILNLLFDMDCFDGRPRYHEVDDLLEGCVIVHPDDFPNPVNAHDGTTADDLWNDIFGYEQ